MIAGPKLSGLRAVYPIFSLLPPKRHNGRCSWPWSASVSRRSLWLIPAWLSFFCTTELKVCRSFLFKACSLTIFAAKSGCTTRRSESYYKVMLSFLFRVIYVLGSVTLVRKLFMVPCKRLVLNPFERTDEHGNVRDTS